MDENRFFKLLNNELVVAIGCTEPIAIALASALARKYVKGKKASIIKVFASGNVIKNAMAVSIPGTGSTGINLAAALGALAKNSDKNLEVLSELTKDDIKNAKQMIKDGIVAVDLSDSTKKPYIEVIVKTEMSSARVIIEDLHTNITLIEVDGQIIKDATRETCNSSETPEDLDFLSLNSIWEFVQNIDTQKLGIIKESISLNMNLAIEGLKNPYGMQIGRTLKLNMNSKFLSDDIINNAMAVTAAASDARMAGSTLPAMSNSGSGNQGISATLPVVVVAERLNVTEEKLLRAVTLSHLITIYIKSKFGRLSALCGATISATGASSGITYLMGGQMKEILSSIQNMLGNVTGILCDGAKPGCALKVSTCTNAAVQAALLSVQGIAIQPTEGIIEDDPENTIENLCRLGNHGTAEADKIILDILLKKNPC